MYWVFYGLLQVHILFEPYVSITPYFFLSLTQILEENIYGFMNYNLILNVNTAIHYHSLPTIHYLSSW